MDILKSISKYQKFIIFACFLLAALSFIGKTLAVAMLFIAFLALITLFFINRDKNEKQREFLVALFIIAFFLHILGVLFFHYSSFQPFSGGYGDFVVYEKQAQEIYSRIQQGNFSLQGVAFSNYYPVIVGHIYSFTVPNMLIGQIFNAWLVALAIIFIYLMVRELGLSEKEGFLTGLIACFYPSFIFYGSLLLKEALVILLCLTGLFLTLKIIKTFSLRNFIIFYILLTALLHFRFYIGYALMFCFIISWFLSSALNFKKRFIYGIIIVLFLGSSPYFLGYGYYGFKNFKSFLNPETITYYRETAYVPPIQSKPTQTELTQSKPTQQTIGRDSTITIKTGFESPFIFLKNTSLSIINSLLGPFPWTIKQKKHLLVLPEIIAWYFLFFFIMKGIIKSIKQKYRVILPLIIFSVLVIGTLSLFMTNSGIITRIRMPAFLALLCLFPLGFDKLKNIKITFLK